jgi:hypothetical protein
VTATSLFVVHLGFLVHLHFWLHSSVCGWVVPHGWVHNTIACNIIATVVTQNDSESVDVCVEITREEVTVTKQDKIAWSKTYSWPEVVEVNIETNDSNLFPDEDSQSGIPLSITSGRIRLGEQKEAPDSSIDDFSKNEGESKTDDVKSNSNEPDIDDDKLKNRKEFWTDVEETTGIKYYPETEEVDFPEKYSASEGFRQFVQYLFENEYISRDDLPWSTPKSTKNYVLSKEPVNKSGEKLPGAAEALPGVYFDAKTPREHKKRYAKMLAKEFVDS